MNERFNVYACAYICPLTAYAEELLCMKFKPAKGAIVDTAKSVVRLGLV